MKKASIALLLAFVTSCSNASKSVSIKTDVGEKYEVSDSAVYIVPYEGKEELRQIESNISDTRNAAKKCTTRGVLTTRDCNEIWLDERHEERVAKAEFLRSFDASRNIVRIKYRQVYTDLNGKKTPSDYLYVNCINPDIDEGTVENIKKHLNIKRAVDDGTPTKKVEEQLCKKWATFQSNPING